MSLEWRKSTKGVSILTSLSLSIIGGPRTEIFSPIGIFLEVLGHEIQNAQVEAHFGVDLFKKLLSLFQTGPVL